MPFMPPMNPFMLQQLAMQNPVLFQQFQAALMQQAQMVCFVQLFSHRHDI